MPPTVPASPHRPSTPTATSANRTRPAQPGHRLPVRPQPAAPSAPPTVTGSRRRDRPRRRPPSLPAHRPVVARLRARRLPGPTTPWPEPPPEPGSSDPSPATSAKPSPTSSTAAKTSTTKRPTPRSAASPPSPNRPGRSPSLTSTTPPPGRPNSSACRAYPPQRGQHPNGEHTVDERRPWSNQRTSTTSSSAPPTAGVVPSPSPQGGPNVRLAVDPDTGQTDWLVHDHTVRPVAVAEPPSVSPLHQLLVSAGCQLIEIDPTRRVYLAPTGANTQAAPEPHR